MLLYDLKLFTRTMLNKHINNVDPLGNETRTVDVKDQPYFVEDKRFKNIFKNFYKFLYVVKSKLGRKNFINLNYFFNYYSAKNLGVSSNNYKKSYKE
jgi:hypothetical protein